MARQQQKGLIVDNLVFETALGYAALAREGEVLLAITFGYPSDRAATKALHARVGADRLVDRLDDPTGDELAERICEFLLGTPVSFDDLSIDLSGRTEFQCRVLEACRSIPWGERRSYGQLAKEAGRPGAARAVGSVMASNRTPLVVPCHRVVLASGGAGNFSAPQGAAMRRRLLALEKQGCPLLAVD